MLPTIHYEYLVGNKLWVTHVCIVGNNVYVVGVTAIYCEKHTHVLWVAHVYIVGNEGICCGKRMYAFIVGYNGIYCG